ncbi:MAG: CHAT domain-containing protein, partial [Acidobacteria bacterium]|nr:CHAT domain-containing protein [Acidobacteriota bacterium]
MRKTGCTLGLALLATVGCRLPLEVPASTVGSVFGHQEILWQDGEVLPVFFGTEHRVGLCLSLPPSVDTSQWRLRLIFEGEVPEPELQAPTAQLGEVVCFDRRLSGVRRAETRKLCPMLEDGYDGRRRRLACTAVRFEPEAGAFRQLESEILGFAAGEDVAKTLRALESLADRAKRQDWRLLEVRSRLIEVHHLGRDGSSESLARAREILAALPAWLSLPEASALGGDAAYQEATFELQLGQDLGRSWRLLQQAEERYRRIRHSKRLIVSAAKAEILSRLGASREAGEMLEEALATCRGCPCHPALVPAVESQLAWTLLQDPEASAADLARVEEIVERVLARRHSDPLELGNDLLHLAYLQLRQGRDPVAVLTRVRRHLRTAGELGARARLLQAWSDALEGSSLVARGRGEEALRLCPSSPSVQDSSLASWMLACRAGAYRQLGRNDLEDQALEEALLRHELEVMRAGEPSASLLPGRRSQDFLMAARVALEAGDPDRAWNTLERLDRISAEGDRLVLCRPAAAAAPVTETWQRIEGETRGILDQLSVGSEAVSGQRRDQLREIHRDLRRRLSDLWREVPGCEPATRSKGDTSAGFRAFFLDDEVFLLHQDVSGRGTLIRRSTLAAEELDGILDRLERELAGPASRSDAWRDLLAPLASALVPPQPELLGPVTLFSLHGSLQRVPMAALPLEPVGSAPPGARWLSDLTTVALRPAGTASAAPGEGSRGTVPAFLVDPLEDLPAASDLLPFFRATFPSAVIAAGPDADRRAFEKAVAEARWIHLDAHAQAVQEHPELSGLELSDGPLHWIEMTRFPQPRGWLNLSGCETGRWPATADSGRYGIGGLFV